MEFHPFANVWPLLEGPKFDELTADIKAYGLRQAIIIYQQKILDGRNRERACITAGVKPRYEPAKAKNDHEALMESVSLNMHRRHMSQDELAFVAVKLANMPQGGYIKTQIKNDETVLIAGKPVVTREEAAKAIGVSVDSISFARTIQKHAPDLEQAVKEKKISLTAAAREARERKRAKKAPPRKTVAEVQAANAAKIVNHTKRELTQRDVDPEFVGDMIAFVTEYGHVWTRTSQERSTAWLTAWTIGMRHVARILREQQLPKISPAALSWLRKPKPVDVEILQASLAELELAVATARDLLERAQSTMATQNNGHDKSHGGREVGA